jgi:hypothetical protein
LIWANTVESILSHASDIETKLLGAVPFSSMNQAFRHQLTLCIGLGLKYQHAYGMLPTSIKTAIVPIQSEQLSRKVRSHGRKTRSLRSCNAC